MKRRLAALLAGVCMLLLTAAGGVGLSYAQEHEGEEAVSLWVKAEGGSGGEVWGVYVSPGLCRVTQGGSMALLLTAEASEGWRIGRVEGGEGAEGLTLTVGETPARRVSVLLDGRATTDAENGENLPILRFFLEKDPKNTTDRGGYIHVTAGNYGELALYFLDGAGKVTAVPLVVKLPEDGAEGETSWVTAPPEPPEESAPSTSPEDGEETHREDWTREDTGGEDSRHGDSGGPTEPPRDESLPNRFMGCRETLPRDGNFTVQFLFQGGGRDTPVICVEGGGVLTAEVSYVPCPDALGESASRTEGGWSLCAFRGLSAEREYVFWVFTEKGVVTVSYAAGKFRGYGFYTRL